MHARVPFHGHPRLAGHHSAPSAGTASGLLSRLQSVRCKPTGADRQPRPPGAGSPQAQTPRQARVSNRSALVETETAPPSETGGRSSDSARTLLIPASQTVRPLTAVYCVTAWG